MILNMLYAFMLDINCHRSVSCASTDCIKYDGRIFRLGRSRMQACYHVTLEVENFRVIKRYLTFLTKQSAPILKPPLSITFPFQLVRGLCSFSLIWLDLVFLHHKQCLHCLMLHRQDVVRRVFSQCSCV